jgi:Flp pilus assembly protein CpaB
MTIDYRIRNIVIAAALAAAAVLLTVVYVTSARNDTAAGKKNVTVYVPSRDFAAGTAGTKVAGSLDKQTIARKNAAPDAITSPAQIKGLYLTEPAYKGEQVTLNRFVTLKEQGILSQLTGTQRAVQVPGSADQLLAGTLVAGNRVDVVASLKNPKDNAEVKASVVLRNLRVLKTQDDGSGSKLQTSANDGGDGHAVILAVTDAQAQRLYFTMKNADWTLELRPLTKPKDSGHSADTFTTVLAGGGR